MAFYPPSPSELWRYWQCFTLLSGLALEHLKKQGEKEDGKPLLQIRVGVTVRFLLASCCCLRVVTVPVWTRSIALCSCCQPLPRGCCPVVGNTRAELIWIIGPLIELSVIFEIAFVVCWQVVSSLGSQVAMGARSCRAPFACCWCSEVWAWTVGSHTCVGMIPADLHPAAWFECITLV